MPRKKTGSVELYLNPELFNSLISILTTYITIDDSNYYSYQALRLKEKIMKYGREFSYNNNPNIAIHFYPEEASFLLKIIVMYISALDEPTENFFKIFHESKII